MFPHPFTSLLIIVKFGYLKNVIVRIYYLPSTMSTPDETPVVDAPFWHTMTTDEVIKELGIPADIRKTGLTTAQAAERLEKYGENKLTEKEKETLLQKIWNQINNVLVLILFIVAVISLISAFVIPNDVNPRYTNWIQIAIILGVIM